MSDNKPWSPRPASFVVGSDASSLRSGSGEIFFNAAEEYDLDTVDGVGLELGLELELELELEAFHRKMAKSNFLSSPNHFDGAPSGGR